MHVGSSPGSGRFLGGVHGNLLSIRAWRILAQRKLGYSPQGRKLLDTIEATWPGEHKPNVRPLRHN